MDNNSPVQEGGWYKATILRRFFAFIIDGLIFIPVNLIIGGIGLYVHINLSWVTSILALSYLVLFIWKNGATIGKQLMKIKVVNEKYQPVSFKQALLRETIGRFLSGILLGLGYLIAFFDKDRQTLHDRLAGTYVVTKIPNDGRNSPWLFVLVGVVLVLPILIILASVVLLIINPLELTRQGRDAARLSDLANLQQQITIYQQSVGKPDLCHGFEAPCIASTIDANPTVRSVDGTGWVKINLQEASGSAVTSLPADLVNLGALNYTYCSDGENWEIDAKLESNKYSPRMQTDNGDNPNLYEIGSNLKLCGEK